MRAPSEDTATPFPLTIRPKSDSLLSLVVISLLTVGLCWFLGRVAVRSEHAHELQDCSWYIQMSQGDMSAPKPWIYRIVAPWLAGTLQRTTGISMAHAFTCVSLVALTMVQIFASLTVMRLFGTSAVSSALGVAASLAGPGFCWLAGAYYYPDLLFQAWVAVAIWACVSQKPVVTGLSLFLALITRDSSALPLILLIALVGWRLRRRLITLAAALAVVAKVAFFKFVFVPAAGNIHGLGETGYLVFKLAANSSRNYLGLRLWTNTLGDNPLTRDYNPPPELLFDLPSWLHFGQLRQVGIYPWLFQALTDTWMFVLVVFGLTLGVVFALFPYGRSILRPKPNASEGAQWLGMILLYGILMLVLGPATGTDYPRLTESAWPAFSVAAVGWMLRHRQPFARPLVALWIGTGLLWALHLCARGERDWLMWMVPPWLGCLFSIVSLLVCFWMSRYFRRLYFSGSSLDDLPDPSALQVAGAGGAPLSGTGVTKTHPRDAS